MLVTSVSYPYPHVDGRARAELTRRLGRGDNTVPAFVLATCLRIEVAVPGDEDMLAFALAGLFGDLDGVPSGLLHSGADAVHHLYRVAAGLESPILGEKEILAQFRRSMKATQALGWADASFTRLLEGAVAAGRQARDVLPHSPHDSMAAVAAQVVGGFDRVAVLGSGEMATAVVDNLVALPAPPDVTVVARDPAKVKHNPGHVWSFDRAAEALAAFPAVVAATSAKHRLLADDAMDRALAVRSTPVTLVDMAMPPDFRPPPHASVRYVAIDDLARMADRRVRGIDADALVERAAADADRRYLSHHRVGPVIGGIMQLADEEVDRSVDRFAGRLSNPDDRRVLHQTAHTAVRSLLARPIDYLNGTDTATEAVDAIASAFGVEGE